MTPQASRTLCSDGCVLRPLTGDDAVAWLAGEDDEQRRWFQFPRPSQLDDVHAAIERWRRGLGSRAVVLAAGWVLQTFDVGHVTAIVHEHNVASARTAVRAGFVLDGPAKPEEHTEAGPHVRYLFHAHRRIAIVRRSQDHGSSGIMQPVLGASVEVGGRG